MSKLTMRQAKAIEGALAGKSEAQALLDAGYSESVARHHSGRFFNSPEVVAALREEGRATTIDELNDLANAGLKRLLSDPSTDGRTLIMAIRQVKEMKGEVGAGRVPSQQTNVQIINLDPVLQKLVVEKMAEIADRRLREMSSFVGTGAWDVPQG